MNDAINNLRLLISNHLGHHWEPNEKMNDDHTRTIYCHDCSEDIFVIDSGFKVVRNEISPD
jgi:hypothetical protein